MRNIYVILIMLSLCSCDIMKKSSKDKSDTDFTEIIKTKTTRLGDTVYYDVPVFNYRVKDTTITTVSRQGTILNTVYDSNGNIANIECISSKVDEIKEENRRFQQELLSKNKEKTEELNADWILYLVIGAVAVVGFFMFLMYRTVNKNTQAFNAIVEKLRI